MNYHLLFLPSISGVVDKIPIKSLAKVPEFPKFKVVFFLQKVNLSLFRKQDSF